MTIGELCHIAATCDGHALPVIEVERAASEFGASIAEVIDMLARRVAEGYSAGEYDFTFCDDAMNAVFGYVHAPDSTGNWSPFASGVF